MQDKTTLLELNMKIVEGFHWKKHNDFQLNSDDTFPLNRQVIFTNKGKAPKIKEITFLGYKDNKLRIHVKFKTEDMLRRFMNLSLDEAWSRGVYTFSDSRSTFYDPKSQVELDGIVKLINQYDALDENILNELPFILNTRADKYKDPSESYPVFDSTLRGIGSRFSIDNSLSYALAVQGGGIPDMSHFAKKKSALEKLNYTVEEINNYYQNDNLALVAPHETGKLPTPRDGYYLIAMFVSSEGTAYVNGNKYYQTSDYHFVGQNNNGLFSHRRGTGYLPQQKDSEERSITIPEQAKLFYPFEDGSYTYDENNERVPVCADYKFVGYIYVQVVGNRLKNVPQESYRILDEIENKAKYSPQINKLLTDFKKEFFLYPPQPEFFSDVREKLLSFYQKVLAIEQAEAKQSQSSFGGLNNFFSEPTISEINPDSDDLDIKYV
jgi:hypothetical protein